MTALQTLTSSAVTLSPPPAARQLARESILDSAACITAGWPEPQPQSVARSLTASGTHGAGAMALLLGTAAHAIDLDDFEQPGSTHPSAVLVPVLLALAERHPITLSDAETAYLAGYQTILALGTALGYGHYTSGWHATATLGSIGAAATAGRILRLTPNQMAHALSIATTQAAGLKAQFGSDTKALHAGFAARTGIDAAHLAQSGLTSVPDAFEAPQGFATLHSPHDTAPPLPDPLPTILDHPPCRKLNPTCGYALRGIEAACEIAASTGFDPTTITSVTIDIAEPYHHVVRFTAPSTAHEARFSLTHCVATALIDGHVSASHFTPDALKRPDINALEARITAHPYPLPEGAGDVSPEAPDTLTVTLSDGTQRTATCTIPKGSPGGPLTDADLLEKATACGVNPDQAKALLALPGETVFSGATLLPGPIWDAAQSFV